MCNFLICDEYILGNLPPGPVPWPILGNVPQLLDIKERHIKIHQTCIDLIEIYGPVIRVKVSKLLLVLYAYVIISNYVVCTYIQLQFDIY